jgi:transposase
MSMRPRAIADIPEETVSVAQAAFPNGNLYMQMRDEWEGIYADDQFADLYPADGQPSIAPWRLALVTVMQFVENLRNRLIKSAEKTPDGYTESCKQIRCPNRSENQCCTKHKFTPVI